MPTQRKPTIMHRGHFPFPSRLSQAKIDGMKIRIKKFYRVFYTSGTFWRRTATATAVIVQIIIAVCTDETPVAINHSDNVFARLASTLILLSTMWAIANWVWNAHKSSTKPKWWDVGHKKGAPDWNSVRKMAMAAMPNDPIKYDRINLSVNFFYETFCLCFIYIILWRLTNFGLVQIFQNRWLDIRSDLEAIKSLTEGLNDDLTALLALTAAAVSIYFTYRQLQAKVKADSRQAWINALRANIAQTIALADAVRYRTNDAGIDKTRRKLIAARLETELMLNPSEKDHRLLMYLIQKMAFFGKDASKKDKDEPVIFEGIDDVINIRRSIRSSSNYNASDWADILLPIPPINRANRAKRKKSYSDLVGYTMRLAHVVLKREWERVKATR